MNEETTYNEILGKVEALAAQYASLKSQYEVSHAASKDIMEKLDSAKKEYEELEEQPEGESEEKAAEWYKKVKEARKKAEELGVKAIRKLSADKEIKRNLDESLAKLLELPEVSAAIDEIVNKKGKEKAKSIKQQKKDSESQRANIEELVKMIDTEREVEGEDEEEKKERIEKATKIKNSFKNAVDKYNELDEARKNNEPQAKIDKLEVEYAAMIQQFKTNADKKFDDEAIKKLVENTNEQAKRDSTRPSEWNLEKALEKADKKLEKDIAKYNKKIQVYEQGRVEEQQQPQPQQQQLQPRNNENLPWYAFIRRFRRWRASRNNAQPEAQPTPSANNSEAHKKFVEELQKNKDVNEIVNQRLKDRTIEAGRIESEAREEDER